MDSLRAEAEQAERSGDLQHVAEIRYGKIPDLEKSVEKAKSDLAAIQKENPILREEVTEEDIARIVSKWTGIPVTRMLQEESEKLIHMEEILSGRVVGQTRSISVVSDAIRRSRAGIQEEDKPIGSFIFLGPTGVGKTELAKSLAEFLFNDESLITRIDMSEYSEKHSVARLVGSPPGYVGYEEGGQLTEAVRKHPYSIVLLDEIEKAHPEVFNILLQVLDDGRLTDSKGRTVNFNNTIIIMTSNIGSDVILQSANSENDSSVLRAVFSPEGEVHKLLHEHFRPEFLNRIDDIVIFESLQESDISTIASLQLQRVADRLVKKDITVKYSNEAVTHVSEKGYDKRFGARPLKRLIQREILNPLSLQIIDGDIQTGDTVKIDVKDGELTITNF